MPVCLLGLVLPVGYIGLDLWILWALIFSGTTFR